MAGRSLFHLFSGKVLDFSRSMSRLVALKVPRDADSHPYIVMSARRAGTLLKKGDVFCVLARAGTDKRVELAVPFTGRIEQTDARVNQMLTEPGAILARFRQVDEQAEDAGAATAQADGAARERAEADKAAAARAKADADRVAAEEAKEAEADRVAAEEAKKAEADRMAAEEARKAEAEKAEAERQAAEQKEQARLAAEEAKAERQAASWRRSVAEEKRFNRMVLMFAFLVFAVGGGLGAWLYSVNGTEDRVTFSKPSQTAAERAAQARKDAEDDARLQAALDAPRRAREREQAEAAARARKAEERAAAAAAQDARQAAPMQEKRNGFHTVTYDSGGVYRGHFKDGKRHGQGTYDYASGNRYVGEWQNGQRHGQGVFTFTTGTVYEGTFEDGKAKGDGEARIRNGNRFKGNFMGAFGDARGIMYFASGAVRRGWVKDGKFYDRNPFPGKANLSRPRRIIRSGENRRRHSVDSQRGQTRYEAATLRPGHDAFFTSAPPLFQTWLRTGRAERPLRGGRTGYLPSASAGSRRLLEFGEHLGRGALCRNARCAEALARPHGAQAERQSPRYRISRIGDCPPGSEEAALTLHRPILRSARCGPAPADCQAWQSAQGHVRRQVPLSGIRPFRLNAALPSGKTAPISRI
ncbi:MORN repeat-containing protein [Sulfitobacter alexandrii]|uniref:MORN repeat-containing protein n=1 Tax=Sulfitobacter alexandrii TaxID=1917485 RepID=UPI0009F8B41F|nr:hypothetical protein [Sulfitobacter alexandrii]